MSISVASALASTQCGAPGSVQRRSAGYLPSVWGDHFLIYTSESAVSDKTAEQRMEGLKMEVKGMLGVADDTTEPLDKLHLVDTIQRLGICYHFEKEVEQVLEKIYNWYSESDHSDCVRDLSTTALIFRLLRQQGYRISCDVFNKFKNVKGDFNESLAEDVRGLQTLYEASHFRVHGEDILDDALSFTFNHLVLILKEDYSTINPILRTEVNKSLKRCLRKDLVRLDAMHYMKLYEEDPFHNDVLLELAKLDFNLLQKFHQKELSEITRWWNEYFDVKKNFPFARDRVVECYFWITGIYFEPEFSLARMVLVKVISMLSIMDDIFDVHGTPDELQLLTDAIDRWEIGASDELPQYMRIFYKGLLDTYNDFEKQFAEHGLGSYRIFYGKKALKDQAKVYCKEALWFHQNYKPTLDEYMQVALETTCHGSLATTSFLGMDVASEDAFKWLLTNPKILQGSKTVCRLMDDIVTHKFEQKRGHVASAVELYMDLHGVTEQETEKALWKMIDDGWKDINEELLQPTTAPLPLLKRILNFTCVIEVLYKGKDQYANPQFDTKDNVMALFVDPIPM